MVRYKYTPEALAEAAAAAHSIAGVMRLLGIRVSGGSHAHISRQLKRFGVDTSHFTGGAHNRGRPGPRLDSSEVLVRLTPGAYRTPGFRLRRALASIGVPQQCEICGVGSTWQDAPLVLHVDHVNGDFLDNRPPNLRLLCPNCHSQTPTYAGRSSQGPSTAGPPAPADRATTDQRQLAGEELLTLIRRVDAGELTTTEAARRLGCTRDHVGRLRRRLRQTGAVTPPLRVRAGPGPRRFAEPVIRYALYGSRRIARGLAESSGGAVAVSHRTVLAILKEAGLTTATARRSRLSGPAGVAERQTR